MDALIARSTTLFSNRIAFTTRDLHTIMVSALAVIATLKFNIMFPSVFLAFFSVLGIGLVGSQVLSGLGQDLVTTRNAASALAAQYERDILPKLPDVVWDTYVTVPRPDRLKHCLVDRSVVAALQQLHRLYSPHDMDAVAKVMALTERFFELYFLALVRRVPAEGTRGRHPDNGNIDAHFQYAHHHELQDVRKTLLNFVQTMYVSLPPHPKGTGSLDRIARVLNARTYKCLNNLSNKAAFTHKHPAPAPALTALEHSFKMFP